MTRFLAALSATAMIASASTAFAGGLNDAVMEETVEAAGPASSFPLWLIVPLVACAVACGNGGTGGTGGTDDPA